MKKLTIKNMQEIADSHGGKCLSDEYINLNKKILWQCKKGHEWAAIANNVVHHNHWCPECSNRKKLTIEEMKKLAETHNGKCLSKEYKNSGSKLKWKCINNHLFEMAPLKIKHRNFWCPKCAHRQRLTIEEMQKLALARGGECLSKKYINNKTKLSFKCSMGHEWKAKPDNIKNEGNWCPTCSNEENVKENLCRKIFEDKFSRLFPNKKCNWMKSEKGYPLELDGYNEDLKLAFEYNGIQHYKIDGFLIKNDKDLDKIKKRDNLKRELCKLQGIKLIEIPYNIKNRELEPYINKQLDFNLI